MKKKENSFQRWILELIQGLEMARFPFWEFHKQRIEKMFKNYSEQ